MALAPFLDKITQSAAGILAGFDPAAFTSTLSGMRVALLIDGDAANSNEARRTAELAVDLLARLYPTLDVVPLGEGSEQLEFASRLLEAARRINPLIDGATSFAPNTCGALVLGGTPAPAEWVATPVVYVGSDGWLARVSTRGPVGSGKSANPFGAGAAACIGAANIFRAAFGAQLKRSDLDQDLTLSLIDYETATPNPSNPAWPTAIDLGETYLVGVGAIGHGAVWAWSSIPGLLGSLHLIDDERYDETNPQRYVTTRAERMRSQKVEHAAALLREGPGRLTALPHAQAWDEYLAERGDWSLDRVALALDSAEDRIFAQATLPRRMFNAWTQADNLGVSRHDFLSTACVACLYLPASEQPDLDDVVAEALRFPPEELMLVRRYLDTDLALDHAMLEKIAIQTGVPTEVLLPFDGAPLITLYHRAVCGGTILRFGGTVGGGTRQAEVPMAFQSALAGVMLAAEVVIDATGLRTTELPVRTEINLLRPIAGTLCSPETKHPGGRCICQDKDFIDAYRAKYGLISTG